MRIALISFKATDKKNGHLLRDEDGDLQYYLERQNHTVERMTWQARLDWVSYDLIIIKSPWDYHEKYNEFLAWLRHLQSTGVQVFNTVDMLIWNSDKHYLKDIADAGLPVIPSIFIEKGSRPVMEDVFKELKANEIVFKPCISASAKNTRRLNLPVFGELQNEIYHLLDKESYLVQPFMHEIFTGELSFLFFGGTFSHCVRKMPAEGDFRVQPKFGGSYCLQGADNQYVASAKKYVDKFASNSLYARVDALIAEDKLVLMELEVIDPYLFFDLDPDAMDSYNCALWRMAKLAKK